MPSKRLAGLLLAALLLTQTYFPARAAGDGSLDLKTYSVVTLGDRKPVYQGPGKDYYRVGTAGVGGSTQARVYGFVEGWMLIGYLYDTDNYRLGFVEIPDQGMTWIRETEGVGELRLSRVVRGLTDDCAATFDPIFRSVRSADLEKGDTVVVLSWLDKDWALVEFNIKKKIAWGFLYKDKISSEPFAQDAPAAQPTGSGVSAALRELGQKTPGGNYGVFSGPGEGYARAEGLPYVGFETRARIYGTQGDWTLISFPDSNGKTHFGWLPTRLLPDRSGLKALNADNTAMLLDRETEVLRDAPDQAAARVLDLPGGADLTFLCWSGSNKEWAYVEYVSGAQKARGFVPAAACLMK